MQLFCRTAGRNLCHVGVNIRPLKYSNDLSRPSGKGYGRPSFSCAAQSYFSGVLISRIAPKAVCVFFAVYIQLWVINACKLPSQTKVIIMQTHIRPVIIENILRFPGLRLSQREMLRITGVSQGAIQKGPMLCSREQQSYSGAMWVSIEDDHVKRLCPSPYREAKEFSIIVQDQRGADQTNWRPCRCPHSPKILVATGYRSSYPDWCHRLTPNHHHWRRMLTHKHLNWMQQHWSHALFIG